MGKSATMGGGRSVGTSRRTFVFPVLVMCIFVVALLVMRDYTASTRFVELRPGAGASKLTQPPHHTSEGWRSGDNEPKTSGESSSKAAEVNTKPLVHIELLPQSDTAAALSSVSVSPPIQGKDRNPSDPLITGDGFRDACLPFVFDETISKQDRWSSKAMSEKFANISDGTPIFVQTHLLNEFIDNVHVPILTQKDVKYRLLTHNSDYSAPWEYSNTRGKRKPGPNSFTAHKEKLLESPSLIVWLAQNAIIEHEKMRAIPIGIENRYNKYGALSGVYIKAAGAAKPFASRSKLLYLNFNDKTNPAERTKAREAIRLNFVQMNAMDKLTILSSSKVNEMKSKKDKRDVLSAYLTELGNHRFVVAPHGHGIDTHRLWEALYMGCAIITSESALDSTLLEAAEFGYPVVVVKSYSVVTPSFLKKKADEMLEYPGRYPSISSMENGAALRLPALTMHFWRDRIHSVK